MAITIKCDRCGKTMREMVHIKYGSERLTKPTSDIVDVKSLTIARMAEGADLCSECRNSLEKWFKTIEKPELQSIGAETCVLCGDIIPEGRQICPWCACGIHNDSPSRDLENQNK